MIAPVGGKPAIVTDSTGYLPVDLMAAHGITSVPLYVHFGDGSTARESDIDTGEFYGRLVSEDELPTTSAPKVEDFIAVYEPLVASGREVVSVHISSGMSNTCNVAREAAEQLSSDGSGGRPVHVVDAATTGGLLGLLVLTAAAGAAAGEPAEDIVVRTRGARQGLKNWFALDTLEFLRRGGRVGGATAWLGSTLKVKPILTVESEIRAVERVRTTERAFERLVEYGHRLKAAGTTAYVVQHTMNADSAERLVERLERIFRAPPTLVSEIGPVIGIHTGPGLLGIGGIDPAYLATN
jgi:DegV family protein with EDD domain